jgi:CRP-like cAMP-binding protein
MPTHGPVVASATGNRFLDALPGRVRDEICALARERILEVNHVVAHRGEPFRELLFVLAGATSEIEEQSDGGAAEVTAVGPEGLSGVERLLDEPLEQRLRLIQVPTRALVVDADALVAVRDRSSELRVLANRYAVAALRVAGIGIACNARHGATERLARWLLRLRDRVQGDALELTHEATSVMLAVRRATVTKAIAELVESGAIASTRGRVNITDGAKLEAITCNCYVEGRDVFDALYGDRAR